MLSLVAMLSLMNLETLTWGNNGFKVDYESIKKNLNQELEMEDKRIPQQVQKIQQWLKKTRIFHVFFC
jgi:hypothetical protein